MGFSETSCRWMCFSTRVLCFVNRLLVCQRGIQHCQHCLCTVMVHGVIQQEEGLRGGGGASSPPFLPAEVSAQTDDTVLIILHSVRAAGLKIRFASLWYQRFPRRVLWFNSLYLFTLPIWYIFGNEEERIPGMGWGDPIGKTVARRCFYKHR